MPNLNNLYKIKDSEKSTSEGIAAYIVALMFGLIVLVVFSIFAYVTKDVGVETRETDSSRAFSAAEAGAEALIVGGSGVGSFDGGRSAYSGSIGTIAEGETEYNYPKRIASGESATLWFVAHDTDGNLTCADDTCYVGADFDVCWGDPGASMPADDIPAVEVSIYYDENKLSSPGNFSAVEVARAAYDPNGTRSDENYFDSDSGSSCEIGDNSYQYKAVITINPVNFSQVGCSGAGCLLMASVRLIYNPSPQPVGFIVRGGTLPSQGKQYNVVGTSSQASSRVVVEEPYLPIPPIFDAALFSPQNIVQ